MDLKGLNGSSKSTDIFEVQLNASHYGDFKVSEIGVNVVGNSVEITGRQEWRKHPGGEHRREFVHRLDLPANVYTEQMTAFMTRDGNVIVRAPRKPIQHQDVPVNRDKCILKMGGVTEICM